MSECLCRASRSSGSGAGADEEAVRSRRGGGCSGWTREAADRTDTKRSASVACSGAASACSSLAAASESSQQSEEE